MTFGWKTKKPKKVHIVAKWLVYLIHNSILYKFCYNTLLPSKHFYYSEIELKYLGKKKLNWDGLQTFNYLNIRHTIKYFGCAPFDPIFQIFELFFCCKNFIFEVWFVMPNDYLLFLLNIDIFFIISQL